MIKCFVVNDGNFNFVCENHIELSHTLKAIFGDTETFEEGQEVTIKIENFSKEELDKIGDY